MDGFKGILLSGASSLGISITEQQAEKFKVYAEFLAEYNNSVNLTSIVDPAGMAIKHFVDSIALLKLYDVKNEASIIDVGTGAGFPGVPLKILREDIKLSLLDPLNKRLIFLEKLLALIGLKAELYHMRAEDAGNDPKFRDAFDISLSRAVASMRVLSEYCLPFVKVGGAFIAYKGPDCEEELSQASKAVSRLNGKVREIIPYALPGGDGRSLIIVGKSSATPTGYPRSSAKIAKAPL